MLYYPVGQKFARNRSISYHFEDIFNVNFPQKSKMAAYVLRFSRYSHFFIFRKNPRWPPKVAKIEIFPLCIGHSCTTLQVKNSLEIALSRTVFEMFTLFHFPQKSKGPPKVPKTEIFPLCKRPSCTTLWVKSSVEIALSLKVFEIFTFFYFPQKFKMAAKSGEP